MLGSSCYELLWPSCPAPSWACQAELTELSSQPAPTEEEAATLRAQALRERKKCEQLRSEIQAYERCGPAKLAEMKKQTDIAKDISRKSAWSRCDSRTGRIWHLNIDRLPETLK
eukprot:g30188.t1